MSAIGGLFGLGGGTGGTSVQMTPGTNALQLQQDTTTANRAMASQESLLNAINAQNGLGNQSQVYNQFQDVAAGRGPNPAQAQLAQATGANVANQAALMAGQRGAGANVGLLARQAAQQGAGAQQQAAGQAAALQAQQSLNALGQAGNIANTQAGNQLAATQGFNQVAQGEQGILQGANANYNQAQAGIAQQQAKGQGDIFGGLAKGAASFIGLADGGSVPDLAAPVPINGPQSSLGKHLLKSSTQQGGAMGNDLSQAGSKIGAGIGAGIGALGSSIGSLLKPKGDDVSFQDNSKPIDYSQLASGGNVGSKLKSGGHVPGKAKVAGNSPKNDVVKAKLSPGEGVIDRETMNDKGKVGDAARFVMAYVNKKKMGR